MKPPMEPTQEELAMAQLKREWERERTSRKFCGNSISPDSPWANPGLAVARIAALDQERDRLARELTESQGREANFIIALSDLVGACRRERDTASEPVSRAGEWAENLLGSSDSPAAEAIRRVLEAVAAFCVEHYEDQEEMDRVADELFAAHDALRALRAGQGEDQPPAEPAGGTEP